MIFVKDNLRNMPTKVDIFGLKHMTAQMANVTPCSTISCGQVTLGIKQIDTGSCVQVEENKEDSEITDYAILQGGEYCEVKCNESVKRLGSYWTDTTVKPLLPLPEFKGIRDINTYELKEVKTEYTFYGYEKGEKCDKNTDPCVVEFIDQDGSSSLFLNENGELFTFPRKWDYFAEATIGQSMSLQSPPIREKIYFYSKEDFIGYTDKIIKNYTERIERRLLMQKLANGEYKYVGGHGHSSVALVSDCKVGIRPVISAYNFAAIDVKLENDIKCMQFIEFPQTVASPDMQKLLENLYANGKLNVGENSYPTSLGNQTTEYEYDGKKYVRVIANLCRESAILSNGCEYSNGDVVWVLVEPIEWLVSNDNMNTVSEKIIFAGVPYNQTLKVDAMTRYRSSKFASAILKNIDQFVLTNYCDSKSKIVSGTEWMKSYYKIKNRYKEEQIPFEEGEKEAVERYLSECKKLESTNTKDDNTISCYDVNNAIKRICYSYRPSTDFLNQIEDPLVAILAALGPKDVWSLNYLREYLRTYGTLARLILKEEEIKRSAGKMYDEKLEKSREKIKNKTL